MSWLKLFLLRLLMRWQSRLRARQPEPDLKPVLQDLARAVAMTSDRESWERRDYVERCHELVEASTMTGIGPWMPGAGGGMRESTRRALGLRENFPVSTTGSTGDLEMALQNAEWRREVNLSWMEFSRWGIQQIILISRLYYIKNPIIRRLINVDAYYVFGRGVEISSRDESLNDAIQEFLKLNERELGQVALSELQKRTNYDGNLFFIFFPDTQNTGECPVRTIDATEIQDIITNPDDATETWYFRRVWTQRNFNEETGQTLTEGATCWYPALGYNPTVKRPKIGAQEVMWDSPILHARYGAVGKWLFGCPIIYPALDWAKAARRYLEACMTLAASYAQIAMTLTTKGGQAALTGAKQQLSTTVGPPNPIYDQNPPAVNASIFASGPGTTLAAFHSRGQGLDPSEVKQIATMCAICMDVPPTFLGDLETANLATATTLDRPTELAFMHKQEAWRELLVKIILFALNVQIRAVKGKLREALELRGVKPGDVHIVEAPRVKAPDGKMVYLTEAARKAAKKPKPETDLEVTVTFPAIREGDLAALVTATSEAMTLGNKVGQIVGIDEKAGVLKLFELLGIENGEEIVEEMYPATGKDKYDPNRTHEDAAAIAPPLPFRGQPNPGGPQAPGGHPQAPGQNAPKPVTPGQEALARMWGGADQVKRLLERRKKSA